jgi:hypothetical protein
MEKLKLVNNGFETEKEMPRKKIAEIGPEELDEICSLDVQGSGVFEHHRGQAVYAMLSALATRNLDNELPITQKTFRYKRNIEICKKLKFSVYKLIDKIETTGRINDSEDQQLWEDAGKLYLLERKKALWLEVNYYPDLYRKTIDVARGEVNQFLVKQKNLAILDNFPNALDINVYLKDELLYSYLENGDRTLGMYNGQDIYLKISDYYTEKDEWKIFLVAVHELLHAVSYQYEGRVGIHKLDADPDLREINEAVTEILSFIIASDHIYKQKTPLKGEVKNLDLSDMSYDNFTYVLKIMLTKVPLSYFTDAMLNREGLLRLSKKFDEVFKRKNGLIWFGNNLRNLYNPSVSATKPTESLFPPKRKKAKIYNMEDYRKET